MRYLSTKTWCQKAGGNQNDLHKLFGKLTSSMDKNGEAFGIGCELSCHDGLGFTV
jgi:hypothetical protein